MASLIPDHQTFVDLRNGIQIGLTLVTVLSTSDTVTVPTLADANTPGNSVSQVAGPGAETLTASASDANTVTLTSGTVGTQYLVVTRHPASVINYGAEA